MKPDFIGIGTQRAGTSWVYACLYEHPELCMPFKEINFFSRKRNYKKGVDWYESRFDSCDSGQQIGEYSTSYLDSEVAAERIYEYYPNVKLIVSLRNPIERAISNFKHCKKADEIDKDMDFFEAIEERPKIIERGFYYKHIQRYLEHFDKEDMLFLIYEDSKENPKEFIKTIYEFLEVDTDFTSSFIEEKINKSRIPSSVTVDGIISKTARTLRELGLQKLVWLIKKTRIPATIRDINTQQKKEKVDQEVYNFLYDKYKEDVEKLESILPRNLTEEWLEKYA
ncbi:MAG: sulfotransferase domain-containing protein [Candidatus Magasanikbacteria bacterium]